MKFDWIFSIKKHGITLYKRILPSWLTSPADIILDGVAFLIAGAKEFYELANFTPQKQVIAGLCFLTACILAGVYPSAAWLLALAPVAFIQNMFFTLVSRSRNSQDTDYHRYCAWGSNGVWFICQVMIVKNIWSAIMAGQWWYAIMAGIVYSLATTEGSVLMMKRLIATEKGKRRVGASDKLEGMEQRLKVLENMVSLGAGFETPSLEKLMTVAVADKKEIKAPAPDGQEIPMIPGTKLERHIDTV